MRMTTRDRGTSSTVRIVVLLAWSLCLPGRSAAASNWFTHGLLHLGKRPVPAVTRYEIDAGGVFVLDRSGRGVLLKFNTSPEIWVLRTARGPRGDVLFFDDLGRPMLRTTKFGGVTVFTKSHPEGSAAAEIGPCPPLRMTRLDPVQLTQRLTFASARAGRVAGHLIGFQAPDTDAASSGVIAEAAAAASEALVQLATSPSGRMVLAHVARVDFESGRTPGAAFSGGVIGITVTPKEGLFGHPSSAKILQALGRGG